jgi:hypothetical protein
VGSVADLGWLLRLTNLAGTVHVPRKLTTWRFHGNQLSVRQDSSHLGCLKAMFGRALPEIYERHHSLLTHNDCAALMLPTKCYLANTTPKRVFCWLEATFRIFLMSIQRPVATVRAIRRVSLLAAQRKAVVASDVSSANGDVPESIGLTRSEKYAARNFFWA